MRKLFFLILFEICLFQQLSSQSHSLWVGESYTCDGTSAMMGLTSDKSWTTSGGYISLSGSGAYRTVKITQYFSGTASVTFSWKERLYANDQWSQRSKTWYFTCRENPVYITPTSMTLAVGESGYVSYQHEYSNNYTNAANAYFSSSNSTIASVSSSGEVIGVSPGTTYINVYSKIADASKAPYCKVTVKDVDVQSVSVKPDPVSIIAGEKKELQYTIYPSNATVNKISWYTNDKTIATISSTGVLTAVKHGTTEVYCIVNNSIKSNKATVNVSKSTLQLSASKESGLLEKGTTINLSANNTSAEIYYTIDGSTPSKNSTRYNGSITINKNLTLKAIAYHKDYNTSSVLVRKYQVTSLKVVETFPTENTIKKHDVPYIKFNSDVKLGDVEIKVSTSAVNNAIDNILLSNNVVYFIPQENAMTEGDVLTIDIPEGAFVDKDTEERCVASKITFSITDYSSSDSPSVENITVNSNQTNFIKRTRLPLQLIIEPSEAFCKKITWKSSNQSVATVSERGIVFGIYPGFATITAIVESHDGKVFQDSQNIRVKEPSFDVEQMRYEKIYYSINNSVLQLNNLKIGSIVNIYKVTGTKSYQGIANSQNMNIPLSEKGFYIVSIGNQRIKIVNY